MSDSHSAPISSRLPPSSKSGYGTLHLIPVGLGEAPIDDWLPAHAQAQAGKIKTYIVENAKVARAFLKLTPLAHPLQDITLHELNARVDEAALEAWLAPLKAGQDIGLVSDAGCPAVADPGAHAVALAHRWGVCVKPWVGPSSILLGLMASGLDGQRFAFHGYAPVEPVERVKQLKAWEQASAKQKQTQLLIETPYRNQALFDAMLETLRPETRVSVASELSLPGERIEARTVADWRQHRRELLREPTVFTLQAPPRAPVARSGAAKRDAAEKRVSAAAPTRRRR